MIGIVRPIKIDGKVIVLEPKKVISLAWYFLDKNREVNIRACSMVAKLIDMKLVLPETTTSNFLSVFNLSADLTPFLKIDHRSSGKKPYYALSHAGKEWIMGKEAQQVIKYFESSIVRSDDL